ncbi:hypothetical protein HYFRA_00007049 [Hymenoscyphus fraxineus]|uniref:2EXR domain-containing protein n=1 Tax=Hymenoscyphus fraxineus TaxID=746836 RepID=A0A9N9KZM9_9HELO|nr:hypothetical protein HYFRA_00007049 [Hymenoscyphus fraxineus]
MSQAPSSTGVMAIQSILSSPAPSTITTTQSRMSIVALLSDQAPTNNAPLPAETKHTRSYNTPIKPLTQFHMFPYLPYELRAAIWEASAASDPRVIEVFYHTILLQWTTAEQTYFDPPAFSTANRESRAVFKKLYYPLFPVVQSNWPPVYSPQFEINRAIAHFVTYPPSDLQLSYINPKVDTLYISAGIDNLDPEYTKKLAEYEAIEFVENVSCEDWEFYGMRREKWWLTASGRPILPSLKKFAVVLNDTCLVCNMLQPERMALEYLCNSQGIRKRGWLTLHDLPRPYDEWTENSITKGINETYKTDEFWTKVESRDLQFPARGGDAVDSLKCFHCGEKVTSTVD